VGAAVRGETDEAMYYLAMNCSKRGIVLDVKSERGQDAVRRPVAVANRTRAGKRILIWRHMSIRDGCLFWTIA
jgi:hypothetical protein